MGGKSKRTVIPSTSTKKKKISPMIDFLAGSYSGILAVIVGHPFDTVSVPPRFFFSMNIVHDKLQIRSKYECKRQIKEQYMY